MWLLCLVAAAGMGLASIGAGLPDAGTALVTLAAGCLAIGASGTFNHLFERDRDRRMGRTSDRPLARDRVSTRGAAVFGVGLAGLSLGSLLAFVNPVAALLTGVAIGYYSVVYTLLLKPTTKHNTVIGGLAGALPAVIGWAAVTGGIGLPAVLLAAVVFLWTPAHFYNLAIAYRDDYARGGYPMLPVVDGVLTARRHVLGYLGATLLAAAALGAVAGLGPVYVGASVAVGGVFLWAVVREYREDTDAAALRAFHASNAYLGAILAAIVVEVLVSSFL